MKTEEGFYEAAADELKNAPRSGLLTKCLAICEGDESKARAMYVRERVEELKPEFAQQGKVENKKAKVRLKKAKTDLTAISDGTEIDWNHEGEIYVPVVIKDTNDEIVFTAEITMNIKHS